MRLRAIILVYATTLFQVLSDILPIDTTNGLLSSVQWMSSLPNLKYTATSLVQGRKQMIQYAWKMHGTQIISRINWIDNENLLDPFTTFLNDGKSFYEIHSDFAIKRPLTSNDCFSFAEYYFPVRHRTNQVAYQSPQTEKFGNFTCRKFLRQGAQKLPTMPWGRSKLTNAVFRCDYVDHSAGFWVGYTMADSSGKIDKTYLLSNISTNDISLDHFAPPQAPLRIRTITSDNEYARAYQEEMKPVFAKHGIKQVKPYGRNLVIIVIVTTILCFLASWAYQRAGMVKQNNK